jgi:ectoine hydroxylase-related dioxygenase (phytanoyl-CoA dioxygenase family)
MIRQADTAEAGLDAGTRAAFEADGAVALRGVVGPDWLERLAAAIERDIETPGPFVHGYVPADGQGRFHGNLKTWETDPDFRAFCLGSGLPALAAGLLEAAHVNLFYDQLFVKEPGTANRTRWHNDLPYWPIRGRQVVSFWLALDPTTRESGALEFVRGSHRWGKWFQPERFGDTKAHGDYERNPDYLPIPDIQAARDDYDILSFDLAPGDVVAFHGLTVHGAGGNLRRDVRRRGYAVRYTGDDVVYDTRPGPNAHLKVAGIADGTPLSGPSFPQVWP